MNSLKLDPVKTISGEVVLPGSKSLTNRALLLAALAHGKTRIANILLSDDTRHMLTALAQLGTDARVDETNREVVVSGQGGPFPAKNEKRKFFLGNAGTAIRPLTAALSLTPGEYVIDGDTQMRERPIGDLVDALRTCGADIAYLGDEGMPPLSCRSAGLAGGKLQMKGNISSQYLTSMLLALPLAEGDSEIEVVGEQVSKPYLAITLATMAAFGVKASHENYQRFLVPGNQAYRSPGSFLVEGDASSASYFLAAAAIRGGSVRVYGIGNASVQGDIAFSDVLEAMGAPVERGDDFIEVAQGDLQGVDLDLNHIPDAAMTAATAALFAKGKTRLRNIYNWRVKETDRMTAMATELRKVGATVTTGEDFIEIDPPERLKSASIDTYNDHRIAMSFSLAALGDVPITINDPGCTAKTFPGYFDVFRSVSH